MWPKDIVCCIQNNLFTAIANERRVFRNFWKSSVKTMMHEMQWRLLKANQLIISLMTVLLQLLKMFVLWKLNILHRTSLSHCIPRWSMWTCHCWKKYPESFYLLISCLISWYEEFYWDWNQAMKLLVNWFKLERN